MSRSSRPAVLLLGLLVALVGALAPATTSAAADTDGSISGQMLVTGGAPIAGAEVTLYAFDDWDWDWYAADVAVTDATGTYQLTGVAPDTYRLGFRDPSGDHATEYWSNSGTLEDADDLYVAPGAALTGKTVMVTTAGHVTGVVTGAADAPLADVAVAAYRHTWPWNATSWEQMGDTLTSGDGTYDLGGLPEGTYRLGFTDTTETYLPEFWDDAATVGAAQDVVVRAGQPATGKDANLARGGEIAGTVSGADGPLADVRVTAYAFDATWDEWEPVTSAWTDEAGDYRIGGLVADDYRLRFRDSESVHVTEFWDDAATLAAATSIPVGAGATVTEKDAVLAEGGHITGQVTDAEGVPLADVAVIVYEDHPDWGWSEMDYAYTDGSGAYDVSGLPTGDYVVEFYDLYEYHLPEFWDDAATFAEATPVSVTAGATVAGTDAELARGAVITGTVTAPLALDDAEVTAYEKVDGEWDWVTSAWIDGGSYELRGLRGGTYRIRFRDYSGALRTEFWNDKASIELADDITVAVGGTASGRDAVLAPTYTPPATTPPPATTTPTTTPPPPPSVATQLAALAKRLGTKGKPVVGRKVKVTNLVAEMRTSVRYSFQWYSGSKKIRKATRSALKVTKSLRGKALKVRVKLAAAGTTKVVTLKVGKVR
jgi:hypothetical protein